MLEMPVQRTLSMVDPHPDPTHRFESHPCYANILENHLLEPSSPSLSLSEHADYLRGPSWLLTRDLDFCVIYIK